MVISTIPEVGGGELFVDPNLWGNMDQWHKRVAELRRSKPVLPVDIEGYNRFWVLTRYDDVWKISRDNENWLNTHRSVLAPNEEWERMLSTGLPAPSTLIHLDGTTHRDHRQVTNDWFKPAAVKKRQDKIDELADMFIAKMRDMGGNCDYARDVAQPFTLRVIMDIYGVPESDEPLMLELTQGLFGAADPEFMGEMEDPTERLMETINRFVAYFAEITENRQAHPRDDIASIIANGKPGGCPMGDIERIWYYVIIATAGHDTTSFALSGGMEALLRHPEQLQDLAAHPEELGHNAAEEIIRWTSPVRHFLRYAVKKSEIGGTTIPEGGAVMLSYPAANRDEAMFKDGMSFDIRRDNADRLISFGGGAHFCLGSQFARREVRTLTSRLLPQLSHIEAAGDAQYALSNFVSGVKHLPVAFSFK